MLTLDDFSIEPNWRMRKFASLNDTDILPGNLFIDCGGAVESGVLDSNESQKKRNKRVQHFIVGLAALAVCDFLYAFISDYLEVWGITDKTPNCWQPRFLFTISFPVLLYCLYLLYNFFVDRKRD